MRERNERQRDRERETRAGGCEFLKQIDSEVRFNFVFLNGECVTRQDMRHGGAEGTAVRAALIQAEGQTAFRWGGKGEGRL